MGHLPKLQRGHQSVRNTHPTMAGGGGDGSPSSSGTVVPHPGMMIEGLPPIEAETLEETETLEEAETLEEIETLEEADPIKVVKGLDPQDLLDLQGPQEEMDHLDTRTTLAPWICRTTRSAWTPWSPWSTWWNQSNL